MNRLVGYTFFAFLLLFVVYVTLSVLPADILPTVDRERLISDNLGTIASEAWKFARPLLQLAFIILILEYVYTRYGQKFALPQLSARGDVRALLALLVVGAFCVAALAGSPFSGELKDAALVVIGFYFGTRASRDASPSATTVSEAPQLLPPASAPAHQSDQRRE